MLYNTSIKRKLVMMSIGYNAIKRTLAHTFLVALLASPVLKFKSIFKKLKTK